MDKNVESLIEKFKTIANNGWIRSTVNNKGSVDDYIKFLHGENSQLNIEGEENLGYQRRPLKNSMMLIKKND